MMKEEVTFYCCYTSLTLKAPITTAEDHIFFFIFQGKQVLFHVNRRRFTAAILA